MRHLTSVESPWPKIVFGTPEPKVSTDFEANIKTNIAKSAYRRIICTGVAPIEKGRSRAGTQIEIVSELLEKFDNP